MTTASARIDIYGGQHGLCNTNDITVSRTMPAILSSSTISTIEWNTFCDQLDMALKPATTMKKVMMGSMFILPVIFIVFAVTSFASFSSGGGGLGFVGFIIGAVVMFGGFALMAFVMMSARTKISSGLRKVCDEKSAKHPDVSFHVRYETRLWGNGYGYGGGGGGYGGGYYGGNNDVHVSTTEYIEVYVNNTAANTTTTTIPTVNAVSATPAVQAYVVGVPSAPPKADIVDPEIPVVGGGGQQKKRSAEERMRELEGMKSLLTEEEYQRKRAEILSDV